MNTMTAITISRQLGSMGCEVAQAAADLLGYQVVWRDLINQAARRSGVPGIGLHAIDELGLLGLKPTRQESLAYHKALSQVMNELADQGKVIIVGRAGQVILRQRPDVFHVRVIAPTALRIERLMRDQNITQEAAQAQIEASDQSRERFLRRQYAVDWDSNDLYDLVINTTRVTPPMAARLICQMVTRAAAQTDEPTPTDACID